MRPRFVLAIEVSNPSASPSGVALALLREGGGIDAGSLREEAVAGEGSSDGLMEAVERVCAHAGARGRDLARVVVSVGPGGFTGVRIGVTTARLIAEATGAACVGVPSALVAARGALESGAWNAGALAVALSSKGDTAHVSVLTRDDAGSVALHPGWACAVRDADGFVRDSAGLDVRGLAADAHLPALFAGACDAAGTALLPLLLTAGACLRVGLLLTPVDPLRLTPIYPREPEAVTKWRERHAAGGSARGTLRTS